MRWSFGFRDDFWDYVELDRFSRLGFVEKVSLHLLSQQLKKRKKNTREGNAEINAAIIKLMRGLQILEFPPPGALIDLVAVQLGADKRARSEPRNRVSRDRAAMFLAENPNASDRAVARGANAAMEKVEYVVKPYPKLSHHSVKKWRADREFQQLVSTYRRWQRN